MDKIYKGRIGGEIKRDIDPATSDTHPAQWGQVKAIMIRAVVNWIDFTEADHCEAARLIGLERAKVKMSLE